MNMQQMLIQAQKMQREMQKEQESLGKKEFQVSKNGIVTVKMMGTRELVSIEIADAGLDKEDKEFLELSIKEAINECLNQIEEANEAIQAKMANRIPGF